MMISTSWYPFFFPFVNNYFAEEIVGVELSNLAFGAFAL